jgi:hypothetical protein
MKRAALEGYLSVCSADARRLREVDRHSLKRCQPQEDRFHLQAAVDWLCRAHDVGVDDGVSAMYSLAEGWIGSYPETTGYIIPTLFDASVVLREENYRHRALEMADWLLLCQRADGSFPGSFMGRLSVSRVFNTGQIVFGLLRAGYETGERRYVHAARRAGTWLLAQQDSDGAWRHSTLNDCEHAYNVRTAWALTQLGAMTGELRFTLAGLANADWTLTQQTASGWFEHNTFEAEAEECSLHTISYCMRGLIEVGTACGYAKYVEAAGRTAGVLRRQWEVDGFVRGAYARDWSSSQVWRCLPGEAQLAIVWLRLARELNEKSYAIAAAELIEHVKSCQIIDAANPEMHGGLSGSYPINGPYERYCIVNWGAKFLADALMLKEGAGDRLPTG